MFPILEFSFTVCNDKQNKLLATGVSSHRVVFVVVVAVVDIVSKFVEPGFVTTSFGSELGRTFRDRKITSLIEYLILGASD